MNNTQSEIVSPGLVKSATSSFNWNLAGSIARYGSGFIIGIVLARILGPEPFGLVAAASIFISIGNLIIDSGLNSGLVQKKEINNKDIHYILTIQLFLSLIITGLIIGLAPAIAKAYHQPDLVPVLQMFTITLLFQAASQPSTAILIRNFDFKRIQQSQIVAYLIGYLGIGLPLAYSGHGVWSLVYAQLSQSFLYLVFAYGSVRHSLGLLIRDSGGISRFGINILGANIANWIISNYDNTSIGWAYGTTNLGLYGRAWTLAMTPVGIVVNSAQSVLFSASSKLQESAELVRDSFLGVFTIFGITLFPFSICEALVAYDLIHFVYGDKWLKSIPIMELLPLAMPFFALMALQGPVLAGLGKPEVEFKLQWLVLGFTIIIFIYAIQSSMQTIIWSVLIIYIFRFFVLSLATFRILLISKQDIKSILVSIILFSCTVASAVFVTGHFVIGFPIFVRLLLQGMIGILVWILVFFIGWRHFLPVQVQSLVNRFIPKRYAIICVVNQKKP
jgi:O-antigen/teichoic acid export membrane protein